MQTRALLTALPVLFVVEAFVACGVAGVPPPATPPTTTSLEPTATAAAPAGAQATLAPPTGAGQSVADAGSECPAAPPVPATPCSVAWTCRYDACAQRGVKVTATCLNDHRWTVEEEPCTHPSLPPEPGCPTSLQRVCPSALPAAGSPCSCGGNCTYDDCEQSGITAVAFCSGDRWWLKRAACHPRPCMNEMCVAEEVCVQTWSGAFQLHCAPNPCGHGPLQPACAAPLCRGSALVGLGGRQIECSAVHGPGLPPP